jgi:hypothetical protein
LPYYLYICLKCTYSDNNLQAHLRDKDERLVNVFTDELQTVQNMFESNQHNPPQHMNMPPIVSKVIWVTALIDRIKVSHPHIDTIHVVV